MLEEAFGVAEGGTVGLEFELDSDADASFWSRAWSVLAAEAVDSQSLRLIVTDRFAELAHLYGSQAVDSSTDTASQEPYRADKPDGARAIAKTVRLAHEVVVLIDAWSAAAGDNAVLRTMVHEGQHVRLDQHGDVAIASHRRVPFDRPSELVWEFVWLAESAVDEFRCEKTLSERGIPATNGRSEVEDLAGVIAPFVTVRDAYYADGNLMAAYQDAFAVLDRLATLWAYGLAQATDDSIGAWRELPFGDEWADLEALPSAQDRADDGTLADVALGLAITLRGMLNHYGFDCRFLADGTRYFEILQPNG